jgi:hypothetical protein
VCRRHDARLRYQTRVLTTLLQFPQVISRDLDTALEEREERTRQLHFRPPGDTARLAEELSRVIVAQGGSCGSVVCLGLVFHDWGEMGTCSRHATVCGNSLRLKSANRRGISATSTSTLRAHAPVASSPRVVHNFPCGSRTYDGQSDRAPNESPKRIPSSQRANRHRGCPPGKLGRHA